MKYDFSGYATKNDLKCTDGRVIRHDAFKDDHNQTVPLVWQHNISSPDNVLGHAELENRDDGVYAYCSFNNTDSASQARELIKHGDINALSIYANHLVQKGNDVLHGSIKEVSLVLAGANPGALIDNVTFAHGDSYDISDEEAIIYTGEELTMGDIKPFKHADGVGQDLSQMGGADPGDQTAPAGPVNQGANVQGKTIGDIFDSLTDEQKQAVYVIIGQLMQGAQSGGDGSDPSSDDGSDPTGQIQQSDFSEGNSFMHSNIFEGGEAKVQKNELSHSQIEAIFNDAPRFGSLRESILAHADEYGIRDIESLFPDAALTDNQPKVLSEDAAWVDAFLNGATHSPIARVRTNYYDITADEARAKGYVKGNKKIEEVFKTLKRKTQPTTVYKKQKLDRDDIVDITDFDVVASVQQEMRPKLNEEIARAALFGDGRTSDNPDKIDPDGIRPVVTEDDLMVYTVDATAATKIDQIIDSILVGTASCKATGPLTLFTTKRFHVGMKLIRDTQNHKLYPTDAELMTALGVDAIVDVPIMEGFKDPVSGKDLVGIVLCTKDYRFGADKGGEVNMFDPFFDIDYNQYKYLMETRVSGALQEPLGAFKVTADLTKVSDSIVNANIPTITDSMKKYWAAQSEAASTSTPATA